MNPIILRFIFNAFTVFALLFFASRVAFSATLENLEETCKKASNEVANLSCNQLGTLLQKVKGFGEMPPDGPVCKEANRAYDQLADIFYQCSSAGTSEKGSCFSVCREVVKKIKTNQFDNAAQLKRDPASNIAVTNGADFATQKANLCYQISKDAQRIRFSTVKAPSCEYTKERKPSEYVDPYTVRPVRNNNPGFKPIEEVESKPSDTPVIPPAAPPTTPVQ